MYIESSLNSDSVLHRSLTWKPQRGGNARHGGADEMIQVAVSRRRQFQRAEANVIERLRVGVAVGEEEVGEEERNGREKEEAR